MGHLFDGVLQAALTGAIIALVFVWFIFRRTIRLLRSLRSEVDAAARDYLRKAITKDQFETRISSLKLALRDPTKYGALQLPEDQIDKMVRAKLVQEAAKSKK